MARKPKGSVRSFFSHKVGHVVHVLRKRGESAEQAIRRVMAKHRK